MDINFYLHTVDNGVSQKLDQIIHVQELTLARLGEFEMAQQQQDADLQAAVQGLKADQDAEFARVLADLEKPDATVADAIAALNTMRTNVQNFDVAATTTTPPTIPPVDPGTPVDPQPTPAT